MTMTRNEVVPLVSQQGVLDLAVHVSYQFFHTHNGYLHFSGPGFGRNLVFLLGKNFHFSYIRPSFFNRWV